MPDSCALISSTTNRDAIGNPTASGYTAIVTICQLQPDRRIPKFEDVSQPQKISDWKVYVPKATAIHTKQQLMAGVLRWTGAYNPSAANLAGDGVYVGSAFFLCLQPNTGQPVSNTAYWQPGQMFQILAVGSPATDSPSIICELKQVNG